MLVETQTMLLSEKIYARLLKLYPKAYREAYGGPMAQLFRDQCRDALQEPRAWGVARLWLRVLPDLLKTSLLEHLDNLKGEKSMTEKISPITSPGNAPRGISWAVFTAVFLLIFGASAIVTFILPESYSSKARIKVEPDLRSANGSRETSSYDPFYIQTQFEVIQSEVILGKVIESLNLNGDWGKKFGGGNKLKTSDSLTILKARLELRPVRNTSLIEIRAFSEDRKEAARIANAIAEAYRDLRLEQRMQLSSAGIKALEDRYREQQAKVKLAQKELDSLREHLGVSETEASGTNAAPAIDADTLQGMRRQLAESSEHANQLLLHSQKLKSLSRDELKQVLPRVRADQLLTELLSQLNLAELDLARVAKDYGPDAAVFIQAKDRVQVLNKKVDENMAGVMAAVAQQLEIAQASAAALRKRIEEAKASDAERAATTRPYFEKKRELEQLYGFSRVLDMKLASERIDLKLSTQVAVIMDRAVEALRPERPNKPLNLVVGFLAGLVIAAIVGLLTKSLVRMIRRAQPNIPAT